MYTLPQLCQRVDAHACGWHSMGMGNAPIWLIANWKMNGDASRVRSWAFAINQTLAASNHAVVVVFCPPSLYLDDAHAALTINASLTLGAQNCHHESKGAFTGEISASMLAEKHCRFVIVGHSECRSRGDCDVAVTGKAKAAIAAGLTPIICIGESLAEYKAKQTLATLSAQLAALEALPTGGFLVAYEPIWAIGTNHTPSTQEIRAAHSHIKSVLGSNVHVLYGGSVNPSNASEILALPEVAGALIGGASLEIETMRALILSAASMK